MKGLAFEVLDGNVLVDGFPKGIDLVSRIVQILVEGVVHVGNGRVDVFETERV